MRRVLTAVIVSVLCASCGGGIGSYEDAMEAQAGIMEDMVDVLEGVKDQASAEKAASEIEALGTRMADVVAQVKKLPPPTREQMQEIAEKYGADGREFQTKAAAQMMKLAEYPALSEAWENVMANMQ